MPIPGPSLSVPRVRANRLLAGYLAFICGFVNVAGLVLVGNVTSHVTGNVTHFANDLAAGHVVHALVAFGMIGAFFGEHSLPA